MLKDSKKYNNTLYGLTNYWNYYAKSFIRHIKKHNLDQSKYHRVYDAMSIFLNDKGKQRYTDIINYAEKYINFNEINTVAELGCGGAYQMILLKKKYPHLTILLFDIPPFLYATESNVSKNTDKFVSYMDTRAMKPSDVVIDGSVYVFSNWMFPLIMYKNIDLFWNSGSFQEMESDVVGNYLDYVNLSAKNVLLYECMDNSLTWGVRTAKNNRERGVIKRVWLKNYIDGLSNFNLENLSIHEFPYCFTYWRNKNEKCRALPVL